MNMTGAPSAYVAHDDAGLACESTGTARPRSMSSQTASRFEHQPEGARSRKGEFANTAPSNGPRLWAVRHRWVMSSSGPRSMFTWIAAVWRIIVRPAGPDASKCASIAS